MYQPRFTITPEITNYIAQIDVIRQKVKDSKILPEEEIALRFRAALDAVHSSTSIEGNPLNIHQVEKALAGKMNSWEKVVIEVQNYKKAIDWINRRVKIGKDISLKDILKLHNFVAVNLLPPEKVGKFRTGPVYIVDIINNKEIVRYEGPSGKSLPKLLNDLILWVKENKNKLHPVLIAGILHYEFVSIHPFSDGNGRVTRLLVRLFLDLIAYDFRGALILDKYYLANQLNYYSALKNAKSYQEQRVADLTSWLTFFIKGFHEISKDLEKQISLVCRPYNEKVIRLSSDEIEILEFIKQFGEVSGREIRDLISGSERTIQRKLKKLITKKLLIKKGKGKNIVYLLKEITP